MKLRLLVTAAVVLGFSNLAFASTKAICLVREGSGSIAKQEVVLKDRSGKVEVQGSRFLCEGYFLGGQVTQAQITTASGEKVSSLLRNSQGAVVLMYGDADFCICGAK